MKEKGVYSQLKSFQTCYNKYCRPLSLPIIGTIFTGRSPEEHGMTSHIFFKIGPDFYYPFKDLKVPSVWDIANENEKTVGIVGTQGNFPVEHIKGFIISGEYIIKQIFNDPNFDQINYFKNLFPDKKIIFPYYFKDQIQKNMPKGDELINLFNLYNFTYDFPVEIKNIFLNNWENTIKGSKSSRIALRIAYNLAKSNKSAYYVFFIDYNTMKLSNYFYEKYQPKLFIEYLSGLDYYGVQYRIKEYTDYGDMNNILFNYYKFFDKHIGEITNKIDDNSILIVLSDHGLMNITSIKDFDIKKQKSDYGIFYIYGKGIKQNVTLENVSVYDITPTVLDLMGLPVGGGMEGKVIKSIK